MTRPAIVRTGLLVTTLVALVAVVGCEFYPFIGGVGASSDSTVAGTLISTSNGFAEVLLQGRTFVNGSGATTVHYPGGLDRTPVGIDFNGDGKIDPVAGYVLGESGVIQVLRSDGNKGEVKFSSLTFDSNGRWSKLSDVAAGDIDGDGAIDVVGAAEEGVPYLHNPGPGRETVTREWGDETPELEYLAGSTTFLTKDEVEALLEDLLPPGTTIAEYKVSIEQGFTNVTIGDMDNDSDNDVVASRRLHITMQPIEGSGAPPVEHTTGEVQLFLNPGAATNGQNFTLATIGRHERYAELDLEGAAAVLLYDLDEDGDLDIVAAAREDDNSQIAWFENPGRERINDTQAWRQWRVGSIRDAYAIEIADLTGDGKPDVAATGTTQQQLLLFVQPAEGAKRDFDWDAYPIVTFETFSPRDVKALDIDDDNELELVVGGSDGAVRYYEKPSDPTKSWEGKIIVTFDSGGSVGRLGFGDLDGDGDLDLVAVIDAEAEGETGDRLVWIRNETR